MTHIARFLVAGLLCSACSKSDPAMAYKLEQLDKKLDSISKKVDQLAQVGVAGAQRPSRPQPERPMVDPTAVYSVALGDAPVKGPASAKVTIVEAAEFACPFCRMAEDTMERIAKEYPNDVRFAFKHFVVHPQVATTPALATCAAQKQGKFWEMKKAIWNSAWDMSSGRPRMKDAKLLAQENMELLAKEVGLNVDKLKTDMAGQSCKDQLAQHQQAMSTVGVDGTPAFYVNGRMVSGAQPFESFKALIDEEIKKADEAIKKGTKPEEYYDKTVVQGGKKARG